jgi:hypothetical protein
VNAVNDAAVAISTAVTGAEDTPYIFTWSDFRVSDLGFNNYINIIN